MGLLTSRLSLKLIACLGGSLLVILSLLGYQNVELHRRHLEEMTFLNADSLGGTIKASLRHSMLNNHREEIAEIIKSISFQHGMNRIRIFSKEGSIRFSSDPGELESKVDKRAEACYGCHAAEQPLTRLNRPDRVRIFRAWNGERILGLINPIENEPSCSTAACHAHGEGQRVLGVLDVTLSLGSVDRTIAEGERKLIINLAAAVGAISVLFAFLIWTVVHKPVRRLYVGTQHVASGDLEYRIRVSSHDEIGQLAESFNRMTEELKRANDELKSWNANLEKRVEEKTAELRKAHDHMIQVERMASMGKLAAIVAHEINNPLAGILTSARFLLKRFRSGQGTCHGDPAVMESLEMIASESSRCGEIVKGLLQSSRQAKGDYQVCDLKPLVQESLRLVQHKLELTGVRVELQIAEGLPPTLCDPQEIRQAVVAVLLNACDAMARGGGLLEVGVRADPEEHTVAIQVRDNGIGMDEETQKHIFEPFFSTKPEGAGVGLGLAVVSGIVARHSGSMDVTSAPGKGTTFTIHLPVHPAQAKQDSQAP